MNSNRPIETPALTALIREISNRVGILAGLVLGGLTAFHFYAGLRPEGLGDKIVAYGILAVVGAIVFGGVWIAARLIASTIIGTLDKRR